MFRTLSMTAAIAVACACASSDANAQFGGVSVQVGGYVLEFASGLTTMEMDTITASGMATEAGMEIKSMPVPTLVPSTVDTSATVYRT